MSRADVERVVEKIGFEIYRMDPVVYQALQHSLHGDLSVEDALVLAVKALSAINADLSKKLTNLIARQPFDAFIPTHCDRCEGSCLKPWDHR